MSYMKRVYEDKLNIHLDQFPSRPDCTMCELHEEATNPGVPTVWWHESRDPFEDVPILIVLGMNPGYQEDKKNQPFIGPSGQLLKGPYLKGSKLNEVACVYFANAARCWTPSASPPRRKHFKSCFEHTIVDANNIVRARRDAKVAWLCCGAAAVDSLSSALLPSRINLSGSFKAQSLPFDLVGRDAEGQLEAAGRQCNLFATYHPAAVLRNPNLIHAVADHLALLHSYLEGTIPVPSKPTLVPPRAPES